MRSLLYGLVLASACNSTPSGTLTLDPEAHQITVGGFTSVTAYLNDGTDAMTPVAASWTTDPPGIVTLAPYPGSNIQKVTGVAAGQVVVTASAFDQSIKTGFTVLAP